MDQVEYALKIFRLHKDRAFPKGLPSGAIVLELGPGDSVASAIIAAAHGTKRVWLIDNGNYARKDIDFYKTLASDLIKIGLPAPDLSHASSFDEILTICNAEYLTYGLHSFSKIQDNSVDFIWSHSVLEHVRKHELEHTLKEIFRVMKPSARASHNIDYQDHLSKALNNLRFSEKVWESHLFADSGFYTNRIPAITMHKLFKEIGFKLVEEQFGTWKVLPTPRKKLAKEFLFYSDQDLSRRTSHLLAIKSV